MKLFDFLSRFSLALCLLLSAGAPLLAGNVPENMQEKAFSELPEHVPGELLVRFRGAVTLTGVRQTLPAVADIRRSYGNVHKVMLGQGRSVREAMAVLKKRSDVVSVQPNYIKRLQMIPNDPKFPLQWGLQNTGQLISTSQGSYSGQAGADVRAPRAWDITTGGPDVVVAAIDSGLEYYHPELEPNIWRNPGEVPLNDLDDDGNGYVDDYMGWDFVGSGSGSQDHLPEDQHGHGTQMSGVIAARGYNGEGMTGVAWRASIMPLRVFNLLGESNTERVASAVHYAIENGADIINASFGSPGTAVDVGQPVDGFDTLEYEAFRRAEEAGVLVVAAACNYGYNNDSSQLSPCVPASYGFSNIISVAATGMDDHLITDEEGRLVSNYGAVSVDLAAPGEYIFTTGILPDPPRSRPRFDDPPYLFVTGTSPATAFVSGAAALLLADAPELTADQLREKLLGSVRQVASLEGLVASGGVLDVAAALDYQATGESARRRTQGQSTGPVEAGGGGVIWPLWLPVVVLLAVLRLYSSGKD